MLDCFFIARLFAAPGFPFGVFLVIDAVKPRLEWGESSLEKVLPGNPSLVRSVTPYEKRSEFLGDLGGGIGIDELMGKYDFKPSLIQRVRGKLGGVKRKVLKMIRIG